MEQGSLLVGIDLDRQTPRICTYRKENGDVVVAPLQGAGEGASLQEILDKIEAQGRVAAARDDADPAEANRELEERAAEIFRGALARLGLSRPQDQIAGIMTTVPSLSKPLVRLVRGIYDRLSIPRDCSFVQDYKESFYYHTLYQRPELWNRSVAFFHFHGHEVTFYALEMNRRTRPVTALVREGDTIYLEDSPVRDEIFYQMILNSMQQDMYTSVFLLGEEFDQAWAGRSTALLCKGGRKVFVVDNLFARGACYAAQEKTGEPKLGDYLYLGEGLVRSNIALEAKVRGKQSAVPLLSAGENWFEAAARREVILDGPAELNFVVTPMQGGGPTRVFMDLPDVPERPSGTTRLAVSLTCDSPQRFRVQVEDLGFGELFPATGRTWQQVMEG